MVDIMKTSAAGIDLIKRFEGYVGHTYLDSGGVPTCCYGHTASAGPPAPKMGQTFTAEECNAILVRDLSLFETGVSRCLLKTATQNEFDAMVSLAFNIGVTAFRTSHVLMYFNGGMRPQAADSFLSWTHSKGQVLPGLVSRRSAERSLFLSEAQGSPPAPVPPPPDIPTQEPVQGFLAWFLAFLFRR